MAFWGVEVKPGKPHTHIHDSCRGALRVSQATLGNGTATTRSVVQCNVGNKNPVLLCSLLPDRAESCCLDLQFDEDDEVVFSVLGPRSVHLTGYFVAGSGRGGGVTDDSESYGEDIWEVGSEDSGSFTSEDEYESDFVDDGDVDMSPSPRRSSGVIIEEIIEDEKPANANISDPCPEKKNQDNDPAREGGSERQSIVKHNESPILESEDEDGFPISLSNKDNGKNIGGIRKLDGKILDVYRKRKFDATLDRSSESRKSKVDEKSNKKKTDKAKSVKSPETDVAIPSEENGDRPTEDNNKVEDDKRDESHHHQGESEKVNQEDHPYEMTKSEKSRKLKKKKERVKREETSETKVKSLVDKSGQGANTDKTDATNNVELAAAESHDEKLLVKGGQEGISESPDKMDASGSSILSVANTEKLKKKKKMRSDDVNPLDHEKKSSALLGKDGSDKSQQTEINANELSETQGRTDEDKPAGELSHNKNAKKKQKKNKGVENGVTTGKELEPRNEAPRKPRTFSNGLAIEELSMGQPDGKRASPGKTVFVHYIGKLQNGKIFDSNIGQRPFKFRLGVGQVIKGWDVGVDGMRIGDKRRLTIPPSMGYGEKGAGGAIPGNAWLIFDVELVDVK